MQSDRVKKPMINKDRIKADWVLQDFMKQIEPVQGSIQNIILFGSRDRGTPTPDSDYDLFLVKNRKDRLLVDRLYDAVMEVMLRHGRLISLKIYTETEVERLSRLKTPLMQHIYNEGISVG